MSDGAVPRGAVLRAVAGRALVISSAALVLLAAGYLAGALPAAALALGLGVLAVGATAVQPSLIPLITLPALVVVLRVSSGEINLAFSDLMLAVATIPAIVLAKRPFSPHLRTMLWTAALYQFVTLLTVINNPYVANIVEWAHAGVLVLGGLLVGWSVGSNGYGRVGMRLLLAAMTLLALIAGVQGAMQWAQGDFAAVYVSWPFDMHKNFVGTMSALGAAIAYARPAWIGLSNRMALAAGLILVSSVFFTQSRQAVLGLVAAVFVLVFRSRSDRRRTKLILLIAVPVLAVVTTVLQDQIESGDRFNSFFQRIAWFQDSMSVWSTDPVFGVGLRWWYTDRFPVRFQPPNAEVEVLTSAGVLGLVAFLALSFVALRVSWRMHVAYGSLALAVLVSRFTQAQLDLFWAASQASLPFVVVGVCIGAEWFDSQRKSIQAEVPRDSRLARPWVPAAVTQTVDTTSTSPGTGTAGAT